MSSTPAYKEKHFPTFTGPKTYQGLLQGENYIDLSVAEVHKDRVQNEQTPDDTSNTEESLETKVNEVITCITAQNPLREVMYKALLYCELPQDFSALEDFIAEQDEFVYSHIIQTPFAMIQMLKNAGGIEETVCLDSTNSIQTEISQTTEAGRMVVEMLSPKRRLSAQFEKYPHRKETYLSLMEFCTQPRKFPEIDLYLSATPRMALEKVQPNQKLSSDYYVDKLEQAGVIVWRNIWVLTEAGEQLLAELHADSTPSR